jgi:serine/threonine protein kinase
MPLRLRRINLQGPPAFWRKAPDSGFYNPNVACEPTHAVDIFGLGSVLYTIITGRWPFCAFTGQFISVGEMEEYNADVAGRFADGIFPEAERDFQTNTLTPQIIRKIFPSYKSSTSICCLNMSCIKVPGMLPINRANIIATWEFLQSNRL